MEITKQEIHHYTLIPKTAPNRLSTTAPRFGVLLRVWFKDLELPGHADLFPWPELGDLSLALQLETLREGTPLPLGAASILWAYHEARARVRGEAFFPGLKIPSHTTLLDRELLSPNTRLVKLKISAHDVANWDEVETFMRSHPATRWRLDFNGLFTNLQDGEEFWKDVSPDVKKQIEFLEDPFTPELMGHAKVREALPGAKLAVDRAPTPASLARAHVWVLKPVTFAPEVLLGQVTAFPGKVVITSSMDHPLGQLTALRAAQLVRAHQPNKLLECGLLTQDLYGSNAYSSWIGAENEFLKPLHFTQSGWGLSTQLDSLKWEPLA